MKGFWLQFFWQKFFLETQISQLAKDVYSLYQEDYIHETVMQSLNLDKRIKNVRLKDQHQHAPLAWFFILKWKMKNA